MKPNIVFVLTDQWRAQAFGYAGDPNVRTPNIDALAARSVNCVNAVSVCPVCTPHRASLLTGRFPTTTGMFFNDIYLPGEELCMAEMFAEAGYDTAYIGKWHLDGHGRHSYIPPERRQGFDYWKVLECTHDYNQSYYYAGDDPTRRDLARLRRLRPDRRRDDVHPRPRPRRQAVPAVRGLRRASLPARQRPG